MRRVDVLKEKKKRVKSKDLFVRIKGKYNPSNTDIIFLVFEGNDDDTFYLNYFNYYFRGFKSTSYITGGKEVTNKLYDSFNWNTIEKHRILFFADKDYDDYTGRSNGFNYNRNYYKTTYYSFENYLVSDKVIRSFFRQFVNIKDENILSAISNDFNECLNTFLDIMVSLSTWLMLFTKNKIPISYKDLDIKSLYSFKVQDDFYVNALIGTFPKVSISVPLVLLSNKIKNKNIFLGKKLDKDFPRKYWRQIYWHHFYFTNIERKAAARGKYEINFIIDYITFICGEKYLNKLKKKVSVYNKGGPIHKLPSVKSTVSISDSNAVALLSGKEEDPERLVDFFSYNRSLC